MKTLRLFAFLCIIFGFTANNTNAQFRDDFTSSTLDPAWTVVQTWPGGVPRAYGSTPGNHYSLTDNPGYLRFWLDPMTHWDGFLNGYGTTYGYHSCCTHDASLEIHRQFSGDNWRFEAGGIFHLPYTNGRVFAVRLYFGTGAVPTFWVQLTRGADLRTNNVSLSLYQKTGPALSDQTTLQYFQPNGDWYYGTNNYPNPAPLFFRVERAGGVLTAYWSDDGTAWNAAWSHDIGSALNGLDQRVVVTGYTWYNTYGSYADWDYVSVEPTECTAPSAPEKGGDLAICANETIQALAVTVGDDETADWYDAGSGGNLLASGILSYTPTSAGTYYAEARNTTTGCLSTSRTGVTLAINDNPAVPIANNITVTYDGSSHTTNANVPSDISIVWYDAEKEGTVTTQPTGTDYGIYTAWAESVNGTGCKSASRTPVTITINPAPLTIKANDSTKYCGQMNPAFSVTYIGFVNGENESVLGGTLSLSSTANEDTGIGTYSISPSGLTSGNYNITFKPGVLTIDGISIDASASSKPVPIGSSSITLSANVLDAGSIPVPYVKVWFSIENGNNQITNYPAVFTAADGSGVATLTITGLTSMADIFKVTAVAGSGCGSAATSIAYLAVYDPSGGFVTGGGWINSPDGALVGTNLTGKANFGFVSKYKKGSNVPDGNTEFQFHAGNLNFSSSSYDLGSLVIAGCKAIYKGAGTINGTGSYGFMVSVVDGNIVNGGGYDKFRIKIWNKTDGAIVYDNNLGKDENDVPTTALGGGSIVIHKADDKTSKSIQMTETTESIQMAEFGVKAYPNPFTDHLYFDLQLKTDSKARLEIFDINGTKLATVYDDIVVAFDRYRFEYVPVNVTSGLLFYRLTLNGQAFVGKAVYQK